MERYFPSEVKGYQKYFLYLSVYLRFRGQDSLHVGTSQSPAGNDALRSEAPRYHDCDGDDEDEGEGEDDSSAQVANIAVTPLGFTARMLPEIVEYLSLYENQYRMNRPTTISIGSFRRTLESTSRTLDTVATNEFIESQYLQFLQHKEYFFREILKVYATDYIEISEELYACKGALGNKKAGMLKKKNQRTLQTMKKLIDIYNEENSF
ncbi:unnamed protein product [Mucor hiemalis]